MKKVIIVLCISCLAIGFVFGRAYKAEQAYDLPIHPQVAIQILEYAETAHQYYVDNPEKANHHPVEGQDAKWVEHYSDIIELIEILSKQNGY